MDVRNDTALHELEHELGTEIIPGTEVMTDVGSHHFVKGDSQVLVPQPSDDKHDPLNWSPFWKAITIAVSSGVSFTQGFAPLSLAPMFPYLEEAFDATLPEVVKFTGVAILVLGFSNFIWVPLSTSFGRRPVYIFSQIICLASSIWRARALTYASFMGACVLNGIGAGPAETIQPAVIADIFFLHDRGFWNTVYWVAYIGSIMVAPIISGSMALHVGWRSFWWFNTALTAVSLLSVVFMFPETKYHRTIVAERTPSAATAVSAVDSHFDTINKDVEKSETIVTSAPTARDTSPGLESTTARDPWLGKGLPSRKQWGIYTPHPNPLRGFLLDLWVPWKLFAFPIAEFAAFVVSWSCSCFLTVNLTQSQVFAAPPYNYTSQSIGFFNFAILAGGIIGLATSGRLSDWISARATRKNGGVREPEMRLPTMIPYVLIQIFGNFIVAYGYQYHWPWEAVVIIGYTCAGIQATSIPAIVNTYAVDSYKPVAGALMVTITVNKNLWGYGFSEFITPWSESAGFLIPVMTNMCLAAFFCSCGIFFWFYGKSLRRYTRNSSVHKAED